MAATSSSSSPRTGREDATKESSPLNESNQIKSMQRPGLGGACNDQCGCAMPCPGGEACKCSESGRQSTLCPCGEHCACNPCTCAKGAPTASCTCPTACPCATSPSPSSCDV
ncbi:hypothetical protein M569_03288 [Genlisea aurea]|uniref:Uncharacterized protein n=1 Tax=Genlisea aurea TaxID=192259 RepID=S8EFS2_9LAMI|nr:hypothetical protein M569_03288 [Genlisea aurea]